MYSLDQIKANVNTIDRQLALMQYEQQVETNRLLTLLINENNGTKHEPSDDHTDATEDTIESLKRPELMKLMAKLPNKPMGFQKWGTEQMRDHLKGVS